MVIYRIFGLCFLELYLLPMAQMVPRMFDYQVEFSTRTVAHLMLGVSIGLLLIVKLSIIRFFKHFSGVVPYLGCDLLWCTTMVVSLGALRLQGELLEPGRRGRQRLQRTEPGENAQACYNLKTILTRPRTPGDWVRTVERMANRQIFEPIEESEQ